MKMIMSAGPNWEIGINNRLIFRSEIDMAHFKKLTISNDDISESAVIMGRKTWDSLPHSLPRRINIVLTKQESLHCCDDNVYAVSSIPQLHSLLSRFKIHPDFQWVIGGASIYKALLPEINTAYITKFIPDDDISIKADTYFNIGNDFIINDAYTLPHSDVEGCKMIFYRYERE